MLRINLLALFLFDAPESLTIEILTLSNARENIFNSPNYIENQVNDVISKGSFKVFVYNSNKTLPRNIPGVVVTSW